MTHLPFYIEWIEEIIHHCKTRDGVEGADAWGTARDWRNLCGLPQGFDARPPGKRAPATQSNSASYSTHSISFPSRQLPKAYKKEAGFPASLDNLIFLPLQTVEVP